MLAVDSTAILNFLLVNMHDFKKLLWDFPHGKVRIEERHHYSNVCVPSPIPNQSHADHKDLLQFFQASIINLPLNFHCTFQEHLGQKVQQDWKKENGRSWGRKQRASSFSPPHLKTSSLYNQHHHLNSLYLGPQLPRKNRELQVEPKEPVCVCACSCVCVFGARSCQSVHLSVKAI